MFQNVSFVGTEVAAFFLAHPASVKKWRENVPYKVLRPSAIEIPEDEETRPIGFPDQDLKTSLHDDIVFWLKRESTALVKRLIGWSETWPETDIHRQQARLVEHLGKRKDYLLARIASGAEEGRFAAEIAEEGFGFIKYPDGEIQKPAL